MVGMQIVRGVGGGAAGAPVGAKYLVEAAHGDLSAEVVVTPPNAVLVSNATEGGGSTSVATNDDGIFVPIWIPGSMTVNLIGYEIVVSSGNIGLALYNAAGTQLVTTGEIACPAAGIIWTAVTATAVTPGQHYICFSADNTTATVRVIMGSTTGLFSTTCIEIASKHPPPASFTPPNVPDGSLTSIDALALGVAT